MGEIVRRGDIVTTTDALRNATGNYAEWSRNQDFVRAQREGRVSYVVHINTPQVHYHVHYDGGKLPDDWGNDW